MPGLGIGLAAVTNESFMPMDVAVLLTTNVWEASEGVNLMPLAALPGGGNKVWDVDTSTDPDTLKPKSVSDTSSEGYWELDGSNIKPLDIS
jgi:hypothetical protein